MRLVQCTLSLWTAIVPQITLSQYRLTIGKRMVMLKMRSNSVNRLRTSRYTIRYVILHDNTVTQTTKLFLQVDVHVCEDRNEWDRIMFFHSYGDLGMILGLIAKNNGLKLGSKGLDVRSFASAVEKKTSLKILCR
jgi:hypothetical protein